MAGHSASKMRVDALMSRPSTSCLRKDKKDVDARHKAGHDVERVSFRNLVSHSVGIDLFEQFLSAHRCDTPALDPHNRGCDAAQLAGLMADIDHRHLVAQALEVGQYLALARSI